MRLIKLFFPYLAIGPKALMARLFCALFYARAQKVQNKGRRTTMRKIEVYGVLSRMRIGVCTERTTVLLPDIIKL
jgi:hypothetical protein